MRRLAAVRSAGERQLLVAEAVTLGRALLYERQSLPGLDRGTGKHRHRHVADGKDGLALGVDDSNRAAMAALDQSATQDFDENRVGHTKFASVGLHLTLFALVDVGHASAHHRRSGAQ